MIKRFGIPVLILLVFHLPTVAFAKQAVLPNSQAQAGSHFNRGIFFVRQNNYVSALPEFAAAVKINPRYGKAYLNLGVCYVKQNKLDEAIPYFQKALSVDINHSDASLAHFDLGYVYKLKGNYDLAEKEFRTALALDRFNTAAHTGLELIAVRNHPDPSLVALEHLHQGAITGQDKIMVFEWLLLVGLCFYGLVRFLWRIRKKSAAAAAASASQAIQNDLALKSWKAESELISATPRQLMHKKRRIWQVVLVAFIFAGLLYSTHLFDAGRRLYVLSHGMSGQGTVTSTYNSYEGRNRTQTYAVLSYMRNGQNETVNIPVGTRNVITGVPELIHYLPSQPGWATLDNDYGMTKRSLMAGAVALIILGVWGIVSFVRSRKIRHILSMGNVVKAVVDRIEGGRYTKTAYLTYESDGQAWKVHCAIPQNTTLLAGQVVSLLVDPNDPKAVAIYSETPYRVVSV